MAEFCDLFFGGGGDEFFFLDIEYTSSCGRSA